MKRSERIQRYLDGEMNDEELKDFRADLQRDPELIEELDLHRAVEKGIKNRDEDKFRKKLDESYKVFKENRESDNKSRNIKKTYIRVISSIAAVLVLAVFFIFKSRPVTIDKLFDEYYEAMDIDFSSRSAAMENNDSNLLSGIQSYLEKDYQLSKVRLEEYVNSGSHTHTIAYFILGLSHLELGNYSEAEYNFKRTAEGEFSYYQEHSRWYLALTYLKLNNLPEAEKLFEEFSLERSIYNSRSSSILKKISKIK